MVTKQRMKAVFDCTADEPGEISFKEGDILVDVEESNEEGWYIGRIENTNTKGLFPFNYVVPDNNNNTKPENDKKPDNDKKTDSLSSFPTLDAFEAVMAGSKTKPASWTPLVPTNSNKPVVASKPSFKEPEIGLGIKLNKDSTFEKPVLKPVANISPSRTRSFSASSVQDSDQVLKPSQLKGAKSALEIALSKGSPRPPQPSNLRSNSFSKQTNTSSNNGIALPGMLKTSNSINDMDEDDGFQILKPSQLKQKQQPMAKPAIKPLQSTTNTSKPLQSINPTTKPLQSTTSTSKTVSSPKKNDSKLDNVASNNPMPRLPSRPTSTASRKSRTSRTSTPSKSPPKNEEKHSPPILKPKPVVTSHPELPPRPKARSSSNPPPIQPKPTMSSIEILLSRNNTTTSAPEKPKSLNELAATKKPKPTISPKPKAPGLPSRPPNLNTKRSLENHRSEEKVSTVRARSATNPTDFKPTKTAPPPPPPSRAPKSSSSKHRYEVLFDSIHDDGYVDGETAQFIWIKSKLSDKDLARIWRECDPEHKGVLNKTAFIDGMTKIDDLLSSKRQQQAV